MAAIMLQNTDGIGNEHLHLPPDLNCTICRRYIIEEEDQVIAFEPMKILKIISDTSLFLRAWPQAGDNCYAAREPQVTFTSALSDAMQACDPALKEFSTFLHQVSKLPQELICMVESFCPESELWRSWSALAWPKTFHKKKISHRFLWEMGNWQRGDQSFSPRATAKFIYLSMDNQGLVQVKFLEQQSVHQDSNHGWWYACLETSRVKSIKAKLKGGRIYLDRRPKNLTLWDTPNIPDPVSYYSAGSSEVSCRIRTIPLDKLTGLTFFMYHGSAFAIHPHYENHRNNIYHTGPYPPTLKVSKNYKFEPIGINPSILVFNDPLPDNSIDRFGSYTSQQGKSVYIRPFYEIKTSRYLSISSLENVRALATFCDDNDFCKGVMIYYHNGDERIIGQYRNDLIREDFDISLLGFHWKSIKVAVLVTEVRIRFSQNEDEMNKLQKQGYETALGGKIMWLFNYEFNEVISIPA
ncbi:hypothetical protein SBOR_7734 [Sclerotinia borealis F-4128]|uniref:Uncharacterized protein n=1 Tax=Sclerotinia borealis (strain F-4128) TaxID=1432307 RepID=W9CAI3_SCLBF|nr:hypothetical protein SBOR_7734 [Sclerotinia borealis F-4128]